MVTRIEMVTWIERDWEFVSTNMKGVLKLEMQKRNLRFTCGRERTRLGPKSGPQFRMRTTSPRSLQFSTLTV